jgi:hypothetical protein
MELGSSDVAHGRQFESRVHGGLTFRRLSVVENIRQGEVYYVCVEYYVCVGFGY